MMLANEVLANPVVRAIEVAMGISLPHPEVEWEGSATPTVALL